MITQHLSETVIQQYALDRSACDAQVHEHMAVCENCSAKSINYELLFSEIKAISKPAFDFDLSGLVLEKLPVDEQRFSWIFLSISTFSFACLIIAVYIFRDYLANIFRSISIMLLCLILVSALIIFIFHGVDVYKRYQRKMNSLNFY